MIPITRKLLPAIVSLLALTSVAVAQAVLPASNLPPNFRGTDPVAVYQAVDKHKSSFRKGKFESTKAFQDRIDKLLPKIRIGPGLTAVDSVTFVSYDLSESYDADSERFVFRISGAGDENLAFTATAYFGPVQSVTLKLRDAAKLHGSSVGQNAFGVKRRYRIKSYSYLNLILKGDDLTELGRRFELDAPPNQARLISGNVGIAVTGKLSFPIVESSHSFDEATITEPEESHYFNYSLYLVPDIVRIFNVNTGQILYTANLALGKAMETWESIAKRTGVSVEALMAANPGMKTPTGKVFVPVSGDAQKSQTQVSSDDGNADADRKRLETKLREYVERQERKSSTTDVPVKPSGFSVISKPRAEYPESARSVRASGAVSVEVEVGEDGTVISATATSGHPLLRNAAIEAARKARFNPIEKDYLPAVRKGVLTYNFVP